MPTLEIAMETGAARAPRLERAAGFSFPALVDFCAPPDAVGAGTAVGLACRDPAGTGVAGADAVAGGTSPRATGTATGTDTGTAADAGAATYRPTSTTATASSARASAR